MEKRIQLSIVSGFLGSGKTTFLQHKIFQKDNSSLCLVINEAGDISIDDVLIDNKITKIKISGGCICCDSNSQFINEMIKLCSKRNHSDMGSKGPIDTILVESSGISDPRAIYDSIVKHPILGRNIVIKEITVLLGAVDRNSFISDPLIAKQLAGADKIYITKTDLASNKEISEKYNFARYLNPTADIRACSRGHIHDLDKQQTEEIKPGSLPEINFASHQNYETFIIDLDDLTDWNSLVVWVSALLSCHGDKILRLKGVVISPAGRLLIQGVGPNVQKPQVIPEELHDRGNFLVLIGRGFEAESIMQSARFLKA